MFNLLAALVGAVLVHILFLAFARHQQRHGLALGRPAREQITWHGTYTAAFQRVLDVLEALGAELLSADTYHGTILAATRASIWSYGSTVRIALQTQEGVTSIQIEAAASASRFDGGAARRFVQRFQRVWEDLPDPVEK